MSLAIIGTGRWGKNHIKTASELGCLSCVCSDNVKQAQEVAGMFSTEVQTLEDILNNTKVKGVIVSTPAETHDHIIEQCLQHNKHVLVEKPMVLNYDRALDLIGMAERQKLHLMVGHLLCYHPALNVVNNLIQSNELGEVHTVHCSRLGNGVVRNIEDVFWDLAVHDIAILNVLFRLPIYVEDVHVSRQQIGERYDHGHIFLRLGSKIKVHIKVSWFYPFKRQEFVIQGSRGAVIFDESRSFQEKVSIVSVKDGEIPYDLDGIKYMPIADERPLTNEIKHFMHCINTGSVPLTQARKELPVLKALCDIRDRLCVQS